MCECALCERNLSISKANGVQPTLARRTNLEKRFHPRDERFTLPRRNPAKGEKQPILKLISGKRAAIHGRNLHCLHARTPPARREPLKRNTTRFRHFQQMRNRRRSPLRQLPQRNRTRLNPNSLRKRRLSRIPVTPGRFISAAGYTTSDRTQRRDKEVAQFRITDG